MREPDYRLPRRPSSSPPWTVCPQAWSSPSTDSRIRFRSAKTASTTPRSGPDAVTQVVASAPGYQPVVVAIAGCARVDLLLAADDPEIPFYLRR